MVSNVIRTQLKELDKLIDVSAKHDKRKVDLEGAPVSLSVTNGGKFVFTETVNFMGQQAATRHSGLEMETHALRQMLSRLSNPFFGKGSGATMDSLDWETMLNKYPRQFAAIVNDLLPQVESKGLLVRTQGKSVRAVLTDKYGIVDNTAVLQTVRGIVGEASKDLKDLKVVNSSIGRDRLDLRIVFAEPRDINPETLPQGGTRRGDLRSAGQPYGYGVFVTNEETGQGGLSVKPMVWRGACTNSIIINHEKAMNLRHIGQTEVLLGRLSVAFADALPVAAETLNRVYAASNKALPNLADVVSGLAKQNGWADDVVSRVLMGTEGQETVLGLVNGVSFAASKLETSVDRVEMEMQAGAILTAPDSLFARAAQVAISSRK
jgi:hypothetical protein